MRLSVDPTSPSAPWFYAAQNGFMALTATIVQTRFMWGVWAMHTVLALSMCPLLCVYHLLSTLDDRASDE